MNTPQNRYALDGIAPQTAKAAWIAPNAAVIGDVRLGQDASIWFGATLRGDNEPIMIGEAANIQDNSVLHTDPGAPLTIGARTTVGHLVMLHGATIGEECLIGIGSVLLNHCEIGARSIVGAGTLIPEGKRFPEGVLILGRPGKIVRELTAEEIAFLPESARKYVNNARRFAAGLRVG
ncbi:MAG: gamma carbonic anhydrase family protein [Zoogloeaceae bacterium]|jgi:carbonic anhydrase/acetyltransferase-like protein (isoleucine patch superfamily)|nr:gamma carbonic anhydrase family protein [Zoogloeaceae bacterium]